MLPIAPLGSNLAPMVSIAWMWMSVRKVQNLTQFAVTSVTTWWEAIVALVKLVSGWSTRQNVKTLTNVCLVWLSAPMNVLTQLDRTNVLALVDIVWMNQEPVST